MNVLIVKIGAIGDVIMSLPMLHEIKRINPKAKITWICGSIVYPILARIYLIDHLIVVDEKKLFQSNFFLKIIEIAKVWTKIVFKKYDLKIIAHADRRYKLLVLLAFHRESRSFSKNRIKRILPVPGRHHSFEYMRLVSNKNENEPLIPIFPKIIFGTNYLNELLYSMNENIISISPGGAKNYLADDFLRRWDIMNYVELSKKLIESGAQVVLIGSKSDSWVSSFFLSLNIIDLIGKCDLVQTLSVIASSKLLITHDSGPLHLSILAGIPVIGLFGPTNPIEKMPLTSNSQYIWGGENLTCRPCYDGKLYAKCNSNICINSITTEAVLERVKNFMRI